MTLNYAQKYQETDAWSSCNTKVGTLISEFLIKYHID